MRSAAMDTTLILTCCLFDDRPQAADLISSHEFCRCGLMMTLMPPYGYEKAE